MALRDGIDTDYDEGDQFEEETVRLMLMSKVLAFHWIPLCQMHFSKYVPHGSGGS